MVAPRRSDLRLELKSNMLNYRAGRSCLLGARDGISCLAFTPLVSFCYVPTYTSGCYISFSLFVPHFLEIRPILKSAILWNETFQFVAFKKNLTSVQIVNQKRKQST